MSALRKLFIFLAMTLCAPAVIALGLTLDVEFTDSSYQTQGTDSFADLLAAHNAANVVNATAVTVMDNIDTSVYAGGISGDYSVLMTATLDIQMAGDYRFQIGTDWGRGGGVALFDSASNTLLSELVRSDDIWWGYNWGHGDVITTQYALGQQQYTLMWLGFEGCCAGSSTIRFDYSTDGFATSQGYQVADMTSLAPHVVPLPASLVLMVPGLLGIARFGRKRTI